MLSRSSMALRRASTLVRAASPLNSLRQSSSSAVYEYRVYTVKPEHFPSFLALTGANFHLRTAHSKLLGYFVTEIGGQNEVVHFWEYESLAARQKVRESLVQDKPWMEGYMASMRPMLEKQENWLMVPTSSTILDQSSSGGVYEVLLSSHSAPAVWTDMRRPHATEVGSWRIIAGSELGKTVSLFNYASLADVDKVNAHAELPAGSPQPADSYSKIAFPAAFSPLK